VTRDGFETVVDLAFKQFYMLQGDLSAAANYSDDDPTPWICGKIIAGWAADVRGASAYDFMGKYNVKIVGYIRNPEDMLID